MVVAPASMAFSTTSARKSCSVRAASSAENSTSGQRLREWRTPSTARRTTSALERRSLYSRCSGLVAKKTWMRGRSAADKAAQARSMSSREVRARPQTETPLTCCATARTDSKSPCDAAGKPASITSTCRACSAAATLSFCASVMLAPGACSPSRKVVSKMITRSV